MDRQHKIQALGVWVELGQDKEGHHGKLEAHQGVDFVVVDAQVANVHQLAFAQLGFQHDQRDERHEPINASLPIHGDVDGIWDDNGYELVVVSGGLDSIVDQDETDVDNRQDHKSLVHLVVRRLSERQEEVDGEPPEEWVAEELGGLLYSELMQQRIQLRQLVLLVPIPFGKSLHEVECEHEEHHDESQWVRGLRWLESGAERGNTTDCVQDAVDDLPSLHTN